MRASIKVRLLLFLFIGLLAPRVQAQQLAKRLILKDGSYQLATKWEVKGDRVRYLSAERDEWEELPNSLVDWAATDKFEKDRVAGVSAPEAVELDKEVEAERRADEARTPQVAPGLRLPEDGGIFLLDTFQNQPQLVTLQQNTGEVNRNRKSNILHSAVIPIASNKQTIELEGSHATVQSHANLPTIYVNLEEDTGSSGSSQPRPQQPQQPEQAWDRFHIVHVQAKKDKRIVGEIKTNPLGKATQEQNVIVTNSQRLTGGWIKLTPATALDPGEYAVVEILGKNGINTYVWDFGVNPSAPANAIALKPEPPALQK
ncbi:MAG TPA: hypothetical protein VK829_14155 [Terriglobales bacterium]|jgi:hypothetical protein|nr:hypothetical protein [Terriglobales bacterium]